MLEQSLFRHGDPSVASVFRRGRGVTGLHTLPTVETERADRLADAVAASYATWLESRVVAVCRSAGRPLSPEVRSRLSGEVRATADEVLADLSRVLATDVDDQRENPLHVLRRGSRRIAAFLAAESVPAPVRDEFEERAMPDDVYGIGPLAWRDLGERVHEAGIEWGAWKAAVVLTRRREEGKR